MSTTHSIEQLIDQVSVTFPESPRPDAQNLALEICGQIGLSSDDVELSAEQWTAACQAIQAMVSPAEGVDVGAEAREQAKSLAQILIQANTAQQKDFRAMYDQMVLAALPQALADLRAKRGKEESVVSPEPPETSYFARALGLVPASVPGNQALPESSTPPN